MLFTFAVIRLYNDFLKTHDHFLSWGGFEDFGYRKTVLLHIPHIPSMGLGGLGGVHLLSKCV